jgi:membrane-associated phospholipid phosphatase
MDKRIVCVCAISFLPLCLLFSENLNEENEVQNDTAIESPAPLTLAFYNIGRNALHSFTHNYGLNWIAGGAITFAFIETGLDWKWRNIAYNNNWLSGAGIPFTYIGWIVPFAAPVILNIAGRIQHDSKLQITGLALAQAALLAAVLPSPIKVSLGRSKPGIVTKDNNYHVRTDRADDFSGEFDWFNLNFVDGWPSGHTAQAFAAAAVLAELYRDSPAMKIAAFSYAALMGLAVSVTTHWASEAVAGALIGYAVGKTVGRSFRRLLSGATAAAAASVYVTANPLGVVIRF